MQQTVEAAPSLSPSSFASLLAALTVPAQKAEPAWNEDALEDDVATLSYERALRTHARYRAGDPPSANHTDQSLAQPSNARPVDSYEVISDDKSAAAPSIAQTASWAANNPAPALDRNLKSASITIRMSTSECEQLRKRAAEAGLTVSAYLRSCTFEAESLRALVKETLAQLQPEAQKRKQAATAHPRRSWPLHFCCAWLLRLLPHWPANQRVAQA
jgi:predicted DNA binding CopG/RHH family protein